MEKEQWFQNILTSLRKIESSFWKEFEESSFNFSPLYRVALGEEGASNIPYIFGRSRWGRWKNHFKNLRKIKSFSFNARLPKDAIIFIQPKRQRFIIVSRKENLALKLSVSEGQLSLLEHEVELMTFMKGSEFSDYSVKILDHGENWIITSFAANQDALINLPNPELYLLKNINQLAMNPMAKFYQARGPAVLEIDDWLANAKTRGQGHPHHELVSALIKSIAIEKEKVAPFPLLKVQLHMDLHSRNILLDQGVVTFIDWEVTTKGLVIVDYFDIYRRFLKKNKRELKALLNFLSSGNNQTQHLEFFFKELRTWYQAFDIHIPAGSERLMALLYSLERTLIYFDKWKEDRLKDKRGLEFLIIANTLK